MTSPGARRISPLALWWWCGRGGRCCGCGWRHSTWQVVGDVSLGGGTVWDLYYCIIILLLLKIIKSHISGTSPFIGARVTHVSHIGRVRGEDRKLGFRRPSLWSVSVWSSVSGDTLCEVNGAWMCFWRNVVCGEWGLGMFLEKRCVWWMGFNCVSGETLCVVNGAWVCFWRNVVCGEWGLIVFLETRCVWWMGPGYVSGETSCEVNGV